MGFFRAFGRVLTGKPVFEPGQSQAGEFKAPELAELRARQAGVAPGPAAPNQTAQQRRTLPIVRIGRVENHVSGSRLDVYADIRNESPEPVFLDRIALLGSARELDTQLRPGELRQFLVYSGPLLRNQPGGYADMQYRTAVDGDYFSNRHEIRSRLQGANGYFITECLLRGPVRDI